MSTIDQVRANQENSLKSTGPVTEAGKAVSSQNSLKHGLAANPKRHERSFYLMSNEDPEAWAKYFDTMMRDLDPRTLVEVMLARQAVEYSWMRQRAIYLQSACLHEDRHVMADTHFALYMRYEAANTRGLHRSLAELEKRKEIRRKAAKEAEQAEAKAKKEARAESAEKRAEAKLDLQKARSQREEESPKNQYAQKLIRMAKSTAFS